MHKNDPLPIQRQGIVWRWRVGGAGSAGEKKNRNPLQAKDCGYGGEKGIRTLDTFIGYTRFPIVRLRPAQPSLHSLALVTAHYILAGFLDLSSGFLKKLQKKKKERLKAKTGEGRRPRTWSARGLRPPAVLRFLSGKYG